MTKTAALIKSGDKIRFNSREARVTRVERGSSNAGAFVNIYFAADGSEDMVSVLASNELAMA